MITNNFPNEKPKIVKNLDITEVGIVAINKLSQMGGGVHELKNEIKNSNNNLSHLSQLSVINDNIDDITTKLQGINDKLDTGGAVNAAIGGITNSLGVDGAITSKLGEISTGIGNIDSGVGSASTNIRNIVTALGDSGTIPSKLDTTNTNIGNIVTALGDSGTVPTKLDTTNTNIENIVSALGVNGTIPIQLGEIINGQIIPKINPELNTKTKVIEYKLSDINEAYLKTLINNLLFINGEKTIDDENNTFYTPFLKSISESLKSIANNKPQDIEDIKSAINEIEKAITNINLELSKNKTEINKINDNIEKICTQLNITL